MSEIYVGNDNEFHQQRKEVVWSWIVNRYHQSGENTVRWEDLFESMSTMTGPRIQSICSELIVEGKLLEPSRARVTSYVINEAQIPRQQIVPAKELKEVKDIPSKPAPQKKVEEKRKPLMDISSNTNAPKIPKVSNQMSFNLRSPARLIPIQALQAGPEGLQKVMDAISSLVANTSYDFTHVSTIRSTCQERGMPIEEINKCLSHLEETNKIMINDDEIFVL